MLLTESKLKQIVREEYRKLQKEYEYGEERHHQEKTSPKLGDLRGQAINLIKQGDEDGLVNFSKQDKDHYNMAVQAVMSAIPDWRDDPRARNLFVKLGYYK